MNCLYVGCTNSSRTRGLCHGHYQGMRALARRYKAQGVCSEDEYERDLMSRGLLTAKGAGGSRVGEAFALRFGSKIEGRGARHGDR